MCVCPLPQPPFHGEHTADINAVMQKHTRTLSQTTALAVDLPTPNKSASVRYPAVVLRSGKR